MMPCPKFFGLLFLWRLRVSYKVTDSGIYQDNQSAILLEKHLVASAHETLICDTSLWLIRLQQMRWPWNTVQLGTWLLISLLKHYRWPPSRSLETKLWMLIQLSQAYWIPLVCWRIWMLTYTPRTVYGFGTPAKKKKGTYQWWFHHDDSIAGIHML